MCPLPKATDVEDVRSRILSEKATLQRGLARRKTYTYSGSGRCRRCSTQRRRFLSTSYSAETICSVAEATLADKELAAEAAETAKHALVEALRGSSGLISKNNIDTIIHKVDEANYRCKKENHLAEAASKAAMNACEHAQNDPDFHVMSRLSKQAEDSAKITKNAAERAQHALKSVKQVSSLIDSRQEHRDLDNDSSEEEESDDYDARTPFGIEDLVPVNADTNRDILGDSFYDNPLDCKPYANACFKGATNLNIRAETFGPVSRVLLSISGPVTSSRFEGKVTV